MVIKIEAAQRLNAYDKNWFYTMSKEDQKSYVEDHPNSKYAEDYDNAKDALPPVDNGDKERVKDLQKQIKYLEQDVKEIEADGDSATKEIKELNSLKKELKGLKA